MSSTPNAVLDLDADSFRQSFRTEAAEILVDLEASLLALNQSAGDGELVARVFRALHTIKGSGAMFGFDELASFTHGIETAYDAVRNGTLAVTPDLIDLTLAALDQIRAMLADPGQAGEPGLATESNLVERIRILDGVRGIAGGTGCARPPSPDLSTPARGTEKPNAWKIRFVPGPGMLDCGADPLLLLRELGVLGTLTVEVSLDGIPLLAEIEAERCYLAWEMSLTAAAGANAIRDIFIFVEDQCELSVVPIVACEKSAAPADIDLAMRDPRSPQAGRRDYDKPEYATSLRVAASKLDQFADLVGELVTVQARLSELSMRRDDAEISAVSEEVERLAAALREISMNIRMVPIRGTFERFRRLIHDLARDLGKDVELTIEGAETELDKTVIEQLGDPLMHLIRNSMDHGVEVPDVRSARGKLPTANIHLSARHSGASVLICISDDGGGIDADAVRARAIERGLTGTDTVLSEAEIFSFIFEPGFSTAPAITGLSGRGVGMDVVRRNVEALHGSIDVSSRRGEGTAVTLRLPLTLAIIDGLLVKVGDAFFVLPLANTLECIELSAGKAERASGSRVVNVRGEILPYICLREYFGIESARRAIEQVMLVETEEGRFGFVVDQVLGDCQTVIKPLGRYYRNVPFISGATIMGNGMVALILDPHRLVQEAIRTLAHGPRGRPSAVVPGTACLRGGP